MQTFNDKLQKAKDEFDILRIQHDGYTKSAMSEILAHCKAAKAADVKKYSYNAALAEYIKDHEEVSPELADYLNTEVYLAQRDLRAEAEALHASTMLATGWRKLDKEAVDEAISAGKKLLVSATVTNDWLTGAVDEVYKPHIFNKGGEREQYGLMKPRSRTRGYALHQFEKAFCKLI